MEWNEMNMNLFFGRPKNTSGDRPKKALRVGLALRRIARLQKIIGKWPSAFWPAKWKHLPAIKNTRPPRGLEAMLAGPWGISLGIPSKSIFCGPAGRISKNDRGMAKYSLAGQIKALTGQMKTLCFRPASRRFPGFQKWYGTAKCFFWPARRKQTQIISPV